MLPNPLALTEQKEWIDKKDFGQLPGVAGKGRVVGAKGCSGVLMCKEECSSLNSWCCHEDCNHQCRHGHGWEQHESLA